MDQRPLSRRFLHGRSATYVRARAFGAVSHEISGRSVIAAVVAVTLTTAVVSTQSARFEIADLYKLRSVGDIELSSDGTHVAYSVQNSDRPGRPYSQVWIMDLGTRQSKRLGTDREGASSPRWSPDGRRIAYFGREDETGSGSSLVVADADGRNPVVLAPITGTNHPLPSSGERLAWSPDGRQIAFVSSTPGPEVDANGDPMVITRYLYKPTASEGRQRFNDNRRLHIFIVDVATKQVRQLTKGNYYEHSIDWSPRGGEIVFVSNREPDPDRFFNYDFFAVDVASGKERRLTNTKNAEYQPRWSPDGRSIAYLGTKRPLTSSETTMEDTHVWLMKADGSDSHEIGGGIDNRQGRAGWSHDGQHVYFTVQTRGSTHLMRVPVAGGSPETVVGDRGNVGEYSAGKDNAVAYTFAGPEGPADLYLRPAAGGKPTALTSLNRDLLQTRARAEVEAFSFKSFDGTEIEAFLTKPLTAQPGSKAPMIVMMHGGPHGQQGPAFNSKAQIYAAQGWATLMVNYRGSTGYGQALTDKIFGDQNGGEAKDVLAGVDAALAKYPWIDSARLGLEGGSYGGQLTNWIITQTDRFKAAVPAASISNLVTQNYLSYYHDYLAVEFGGFPHENGIIDRLWERSAIRYANKVKTPTMFIHGDNDNDVPIAEAEQFYIALKDVGVETIMIRYPREGHGLRETAHVADSIERSIAWYRKHFEGGRSTTSGR
jgi:dipeptidyl aminopeptidase/acylaminoacyl peptidase